MRILYETQLLLPEKQSIAVSYDMENQLYFSLLEEGKSQGEAAFLSNIINHAWHSETFLWPICLSVAEFKVFLMG